MRIMLCVSVSLSRCPRHVNPLVLWDHPLLSFVRSAFARTNDLENIHVLVLQAQRHLVP